ncbi:MAG: translation initiation factor IF-2 associated domain-containing protein [Rhodospirillaceae bacterium]|nr:translation initiation factor IF-2 associated domain-containing protein [Rhodospirillaceae bacterium]
MSDVTVTEFAQVLRVPVEKLLLQLGEAGIQVADANDTISEDAKLELLTHLRRSHGRKDPAASAPRKITLKRKSQSELRLAGGAGRSRTVNVEVRRKRTYIKRDVLEEQARQKQQELDAQREAEQAKAQAETERLEQERRAVEEAAAKAEEARRQAEARQQAEDESKRRADEEARRSEPESSEFHPAADDLIEQGCRSHAPRCRGRERQAPQEAPAPASGPRQRGQPAWVRETHRTGGAGSRGPRNDHRR